MSKETAVIITVDGRDYLLNRGTIDEAQSAMKLLMGANPIDRKWTVHACKSAQVADPSPVSVGLQIVPARTVVSAEEWAEYEAGQRGRRGCEKGGQVNTLTQVLHVQEEHALPPAGMRQLHPGEIVSLQEGKMRVRFVNECRAFCTPTARKVVEIVDRFGKRKVFKVRQSAGVSISPFITAEEGGAK